MTLTTWHFDIGWQNVAVLVGVLGTFAFVFGFDDAETQILRQQKLKSLEKNIGLGGLGALMAKKKE